MKFDKKLIIVALILSACIAIISLLIYPQWQGTWWILLCTVIIGVVSFMANFRQAFEKSKKKRTPESIDNSLNKRAIHENQARVHCAPPQPSLMIGREDDLTELKSRVLGNKKQGSSLQVLTTIKGWPGVGKTTVVSALAHDPEVANWFSDGVLWVSLGDAPDILSKLIYWGRVAGVEIMKQATSVEEATGLLTGALLQKKILFIIDDVWQAEDFYPFQVGGENSATLVTTRLDKVARAIAPIPKAIYRLPILSDSDSMNLLRQLAPSVVGQYPRECLTLVRQLEGLPLALQVAGRLLHTERSYGFGVLDLLKELGEGAELLRASAPPDRMDIVNQTTPTVAALLQKSVDRLDDTTKQCFSYLGVFAPKPATFDVKSMAFVWQMGNPNPIIKNLVDRGLLEYLPEIDRYQMHALLVMLAKSILTEED